MGDLNLSDCKFGGVAVEEALTFQFSASLDEQIKKLDLIDEENAPNRTYKSSELVDTNTLYVANKTYNEIFIKRIEIYIGEQNPILLATLENSSSPREISAYKFIIYSMGKFNKSAYSSTYILSNNSCGFSAPGKKYLFMKVYFGGSFDGGYYTYKTRYYVEVGAKIAFGISVSSLPTKKVYYINETLNTNGLTVKALYKFFSNDTYASTSEVYAYQISCPEFSTPGTKKVELSYNGCLASFNITVYGIKSYTLAGNKKTSFRELEAFDSPSLTFNVTYEDNTTEAVNATLDKSNVDFTKAGTYTVNAKSAATKTKETLTSSYQVTVFALQSISINTTNVKKIYTKGDALDKSNLTAIAYFDNASSLSLTSSNLVVTGFDTNKLGKQTLTVFYTHNEVTCNRTYEIEIEGIAEIKADISDCNYYYDGRLRIPKGGILTTTNKKIYIKKYKTSIHDVDEWELYDGLISTIADSNITSSIGTNKTITFTINVNDIDYSCVCQVDVYTHSLLTLEEYLTKFYIKEGINPTLACGNMSVIAKCSDGVDTELNSEQYTISPAIGTQLQAGITRVIVSSILNPKANSSYNVFVENNTPKSTASIIVEGQLTKTVYNIGDTLNTNGITVKVSEMVGGETNYIVEYTASIKNKTTNTFTEDDTKGSYSILINVDGIENAYELENAITLDGIDEITNVACKKSIYKAGEKITKDQITGTISFLGGSSRSVTADDISDLRTIAFSSTEAGSQTVTLKVCGIEKSVTVTVIKVTSISIDYGVNSVNRSFNIHDKVDLMKWKITKTYSNNTTETLPLDAKEKMTYTFASECTLDDLEPTSLNTAVTELTISYTEAGVTVTLDTSINIKALKQVELYDEDANLVSKISVNYGDKFTLVGYVIKAIYNDGSNTQHTLNDTNYLTNPEQGTLIKSKIDSATIGYTFCQETKYATFTIHSVYLDDVTVDFSSIPTTMYEGDTITLSGVTGTKTIKSTDTTDSNYPAITNIGYNDLVFDIDGMNVTNGSYLPPAKTTNYNLNATYILEGNNNTAQIRSKSYEIHIASVILQSISLSYEETFKDIETYVEGQNLNLSGLCVNVVFNRTSSNITLPYTNENIKVYIEGDTVNPISKTRVLSLSDNNKELTLTYTHNGITRSAVIGGDVKLVVIAKQLSSIEIIGNPTKMVYTYGDTFTLEGIIVKAKFNDDSTAQILYNNPKLSYNIFTEGYKINENDDMGDRDITITYTHGEIAKTATLTVTLNYPYIIELQVNATTAVRTFTDLTTYSSAGLVVYAIMNKKNEAILFKKEITNFTTDATTVLNLDSTNKIQCTGNYGTKTITVTATNPYIPSDSKTGTYTVDIKTSSAPVSAALQVDENIACDYNVGDSFTAKGIKFLVTDIDGNKFTATDFVTNPQIGTILRSAKRMRIEVSYVNSSFSVKDEYYINVNIKDKFRLTDTKDYQIAIGKSDGALFTSIDYSGVKINLGEQEDGSKYYPVFLNTKVSVDTDVAHTKTYGFNVYTGTTPNIDCIGYMDMGIQDDYGNIIKNAHFIQFEDTINPIEGNGNIVVKFPHYIPGYADRINKCTFGIIYNKHLFLSGNSKYKNMDWYNEEINTAQIEDYDKNANRDFTYFSDLNYCKYGSDSKAILGYDIYRDGDLVVFKESADDEATLYRRSKKNITATDYTGQTINGYYEDSYPCFDINSNGGSSAVNRFSIINFLGDSLFLTKYGLKTLTTSSTINNSEKYAYDVSSYINNRITKEELENSFLYTYGEKIYLKTNRGLYVGDYNLRNESNEYEWFFFDIKNIDLLFVIDGILYFADNDGNYYRFKDNYLEGYTDKVRTYIASGGAMLSLNETEDTIIVNKKYAENVKEGNTFHLLTKYTFENAGKSSQVFASLGSFYNENLQTVMDKTAYIGHIDTTKNCIEIKPYLSNGNIDYDRYYAKRDLFYDGRKIYLDKIVGKEAKVSADNEYYLVKVDKENPLEAKYYIYDSDTKEKASLGEIETFRMSFVVNELAITTIGKVTENEDGGKSFKLIGDHDKELDLIYYNNRSESYSGVITDERNIDTFFITKPYNMGTLLNEKVIYMWSISNDTALSSEMNVGYLTNRKQGNYEMIIKSSEGSSILTSDSIRFDKLRFTSDLLPHIYTRNRMIPNIGFIRFIFSNDADSNIVLERLCVAYSIGQSTKGVK